MLPLTSNKPPNGDASAYLLAPRARDLPERAGNHGGITDLVLPTLGKKMIRHIEEAGDMLQAGLAVLLVFVVLALAKDTRGSMLAQMRTRQRWLPLVPDSEQQPCEHRDDLEMRRVI